MPLYEFECQRCHSRFEELVRGQTRVSDVRCPSCGTDEVDRQVSAAAVGGGDSVASGRTTPSPRRSCTPFS